MALDILIVNRVDQHFVMIGSNRFAGHSIASKKRVAAESYLGGSEVIDLEIRCCSVDFIMRERQSAG